MHVRRIWLAGLVGALLCGQTVAAQDGVSRARLGAKIPNLTFQDEAGKPLALHDFKDKKVIVVTFLSFDCPVSNSYAKPLADMYQEYASHGVAFLGLTTNPDESDAQVAKHARDYKIPFRLLKDANFTAADALAAEITPEVFVLDGNFVLRYRGRIDNAYYQRLKHQQVSERNLHQVIGELLSGRPVSVEATEAVGCSIPRPVKELSARSDVTFHRDVLPILQNRCQTCHRPGEVGPFSLMTYRQAVNWADDIKTFTHKGQMPPWKPKEGGPFQNDRRITQKEIDTIARWVDGGTPEGDSKQAPAPRVFADGWQLGTPDLVLKVPEQFTLGPTGSDAFRCFVLPTNLTEDKHVVAIEVRPGNPRVVHHTLQFYDTTGQGRKLEEAAQNKKPEAHGEPVLDKGPGYSVAMGVGFLPSGGLSGWAPGQMPRYLPEGTGYFLAKGSDVIIQVHYHRNGKVEHDQTMVGLHFAKKPIAHTYRGDIMAGAGPLFSFMLIPAGDENYKIQGDKYAKEDFLLYSIMPHMHLLGKEIKVTMTPPGEDEQTLIHIPEWDYNWQETYFFKEPVRVKAGARFHIEASYDNSSKNPNNPSNPPKLVRYGEQTTNEMCFVFLGGISDSKGRRLPMDWIAPPKKAAAAAAQ